MLEKRRYTNFLVVRTSADEFVFLIISVLFAFTYDRIHDLSSTLFAAWASRSTLDEIG